MLTDNMLAIDTTIKNGKWSENHRKITEHVLRAAFNIAAPHDWRQAAHCEVSVLLCDDETMRAINKKWRHNDKSTNVLSFPQNDDIALSHNCEKKPFCLGDIILAFETIGAEASDKNIDPSTHLRHLIVHGFLHLAGYDHQNAKQEKVMQNMENKILKSLE